ncbi:FtsJ-like methyltransferase-domain-containing protein [Dunaliella salina]|uniref:FtsJ-like methyltransferase-domain-containing protein n=1 Tax=Dunaliella salina TaxID=3046 RepID=A0ABQ7GGS2_DUNSA|nr:FtsJ-like methyltransferase-domain-containing protein [Dunaliella salina]|eukprot:KAF5833809.1 FtsJ-like methyltransferase-domain-containing protein [Dunaliella salina]
MVRLQWYRSRAAFKLVQLNRKYGLLGNCRALLDLCAAPGGWLQVAAQNMPMASLIVGVDLVPIKPIRGVKTMLGDITTQACRSGLKKLAGGSSFDVVVHDGAPNIGGAWTHEAYSQAALVLDSLRLATEFLAPKGTFVSKVFRSKDYNALLYACNQLFTKVESTKPTASRNASAEIFVVCQGYKAPAKIDPRLLDPRHLFQEVSDAPRVMGPEALLRQKIKQHRHRSGYEDGLSTMHKVVPALGFLAASAPVEMLGQVTQIALDGPGSWEAVPALPHAKDLKELAHLGDHKTLARVAEAPVLSEKQLEALEAAGSSEEEEVFDAKDGSMSAVKWTPLV